MFWHEVERGTNRHDRPCKNDTTPASAESLQTLTPASPSDWGHWPQTEYFFRHWPQTEYGPPPAASSDPSHPSPGDCMCADWDPWPDEQPRVRCSELAGLAPRCRATPAGCPPNQRRPPSWRRSSRHHAEPGTERSRASCRHPRLAQHQVEPPEVSSRTGTRVF